MPLGALLYSSTLQLPAAYMYMYYHIVTCHMSKCERLLLLSGLRSRAKPQSRLSPRPIAGALLEDHRADDRQLPPLGDVAGLAVGAGDVVGVVVGALVVNPHEQPLQSQPSASF